MSKIPSLVSCRRATSFLTVIAIGFLLLRTMAACFDLGSLQSGKKDAAPDAPDAGTEVDADTSATDMTPSGSVDMLYAWNPAAPPGAAPGCRSGLGYKLDAAGKLYACVGAFNYPDGDKQCSTGWMMPLTLTIPESACAAVPWGFFAAGSHAIGRKKTPVAADTTCSWQAPDASYVFAYRHGCGQAGRGHNGKIYTFADEKKCGGFPTVAACTGLTGFSSADTPYGCDPPSAPYEETFFPGYTTLSKPTDGVLCAQP